MKKFESNTKPDFKCYISLSIQPWQGNVGDRAHAPQHAPKMHFRCALFTQLEHNYRASCSRSKNFFK